MQDSPQTMVSVIIAVFNGAQYVAGAVESVLAQTFRDFEIIVVDDGSTDNTKAVLEPWISGGKIKYLFQQNRGLAAARNAGVRQAGGKYLKFLDCDDFLYPGQLEAQVKHLEAGPETVISATDYDLEFESKKKINILLTLKEDQLAQFIEGNPCPVHTVLVRRDMVNREHAFDESLRSHEDSDLWLRILLRGGVFERTASNGCCYRIHGGALSEDTKRMFGFYCKFSEKLNHSLKLRFKHLSQEALRQLFFRNLQTIHKCYCQDIRPAEQLPETLKAAAAVHAMTSNWLERIRIMMTGIEPLARGQYEKAVEKDKKYAEKLMNTAWRDERYYMREDEDSPYVEVEPLSLQKLNAKNILYLNSSPVIYGAETRLLDIIKNLDRNKYRPFVLLPFPGPLEERLKEMKVRVMHLDYGFPVDMSNFFQKETLRRLWRINKDLVAMIRWYKIDIIHANLHINMSKFFLTFWYLRLPVIVHLRSHFRISLFEKFIIAHAFRIIYISKFVEREFVKKRSFDFLMPVRPERTFILHDGIDINHFSPGPMASYIHKEFNIAHTDFLIGIIGAVDKVKGQDLLLQALARVIQKHPHVKLLIVGDLYHHGKTNIEYREGLLKFIKEAGLSDHVIFTGVRGDIRFLMNEIDLLVQPSEREALGTSMVEAMASGKPVIGSNVDGIPEVIGPDEAGIVFKHRTPEDLEKAINFFIENPKEAHQKGAHGRERALRLFNIYVNIKRIESLYDEALGHRWLK
jgi:glycosyltransferase involved in cell wall biosynthesis/GT2 family glycosyltransferase